MFPMEKEHAEIVEKVKKIRKFQTKDLVKRLAVITSQRISVENYPENTPKSVFNPSLKITPQGLKIFARISVGYYTYTSGIIEFELPFEDLTFDSTRIYKGTLSILPDNRFDFWGVEDPRYYEIDGRELITYCGRTVNYFQTHIRVERTLPVTALKVGDRWKKIAVFRMPEEVRSFVVSDKNAFLVKGDTLMLFHRLHMLNENFYLNICNVPEEILELEAFREVEIGGNITALEPCEFESKIGWATPPVKVNDEYLVLLHGVDKELSVYRAFAALINKKGLFSAVSPCYIMEPKKIYEIYGDRPYVVFPCGAQIFEDKIFIAYGGADSVIGIGEIPLEPLLELLYSNSI